MKTISDIVAEAGGPEKVAQALDDAITADGVRKWRRNGVPDRYWSKLTAITSSDVAAIFAANELTRGVLQPASVADCSSEAVAAAAPASSSSSSIIPNEAAPTVSPDSPSGVTHG